VVRRAVVVVRRAVVVVRCGGRVVVVAGIDVGVVTRVGRMRDSPRPARNQR
jgi:hypothetical protein